MKTRCMHPSTLRKTQEWERLKLPWLCFIQQVSNSPSHLVPQRGGAYIQLMGSGQGSQQEREAVLTLWVGLILHTVVALTSECTAGIGMACAFTTSHPVNTRDGTSQLRRARCREELLEQTPLMLATSSWVRI